MLAEEREWYNFLRQIPSVVCELFLGNICHSLFYITVIDQPMNKLEIVNGCIGLNASFESCRSVKKRQECIHSLQFHDESVIITHCSGKHKHLSSIDIARNPTCLMNSTGLEKVNATKRCRTQNNESILPTFSVVISWCCDA